MVIDPDSQRVLDLIKESGRPPFDTIPAQEARANGVTRLALYCHGRQCWHQAVLDVSSYPGDLPVASFRGRVVCSRCGSRDVDVRPDWTQRGWLAPAAPSGAALA
jgi:hypothetical protein